jgi:hypothetical protein
MDIPVPGGGGGHVGNGGSGAEGSALGQCPTLMLTECVEYPGATGGAGNPVLATLATMPDLRTLMETPQALMGSPGGYSHAGCPNDGTIRDGAPGGGVIILEAGTVALEGSLTADGAAGSVLFRAGPGSGAGGTIVIIAPEFSYAPTAVISAAGGQPSGGSTHSNVLGGGGGGGLVVLAVPSTTENTALLNGADVEGGSLTTCSSGILDGGDGAAVTFLPDCPDADEDGFANESCDGEDCDDGDASVHPDAPESCNAFSDDCDSEIDEPNDDPEVPLCAAGTNTVCQPEGCEPKTNCCVEPTAPPAGGPGSRLAVRFGGGVCTGAAGRSPSDGALGAALLALGAVLLRLRARKR